MNDFAMDSSTGVLMVKVGMTAFVHEISLRLTTTGTNQLIETATFSIKNACGATSATLTSSIDQSSYSFKLNETSKISFSSFDCDNTQCC